MIANKAKSLAYHRAYYASHPEYRNKIKQRQKTPERRAYQKAYRENNRVEILRKQRERSFVKYHSNIEQSRLQSRIKNSLPSAIKWRAENLEHIKSLNREWSRNSRNKRNATLAKLRAFKACARGWNYTTAEHIRARWEMFGNKCWICGLQAEQTDHVKPLKKGCAHFPANLRPICKRCNHIKKDRNITVDPAQPPAEFMVGEKNPEFERNQPRIPTSGRVGTD